MFRLIRSLWPKAKPLFFNRFGKQAGKEEEDLDCLLKKYAVAVVDFPDISRHDGKEFLALIRANKSLTVLGNQFINYYAFFVVVVCFLLMLNNRQVPDMLFVIMLAVLFYFIKIAIYHTKSKDQNPKHIGITDNSVVFIHEDGSKEYFSFSQYYITIEYVYINRTRKGCSVRINERGQNIKDVKFFFIDDTIKIFCNIYKIVQKNYRLQCQISQHNVPT